MIIEDVYSHKGGKAFIQDRHKIEWSDVEAAVKAVDAVDCLRKITEEKTKPPLLFSPPWLNLRLKEQFCDFGWTEKNGSKKGYKEPRINLGRGAFREMDGIKNKVGLEIQFGKYAFMGYDIFSKMPIFNQRGLIDCGIEIVAMHNVVKEMSTGVSSFMQITKDLEICGEADIDIPVLIVGIGLTKSEIEGCKEKRERFRTQGQKMIEAGEVSKKKAGAKPGPKGKKGVFDEDDELDDEEEAEPDEE